MTTKYRYFVYLLSLHVVMGSLTYLLLSEKLYWFLAVEVLLLVSLIIGMAFYRIFLGPTDLVKQGEAALEDGDFTAKFIHSDSPEVDRIVRLYNRMVENLRQERTKAEERHYFLQKLISSAELGIIILDHDDQITSLNPWAIKRLDYQSSSGQRKLDELNNNLAKQLALLKPNRAEVLNLPGAQRYRVEKGSFIDRGFNRSFILVQDITRDLLSAEKEAYGKVIRMMAHEVNNSNGATQSMLESLLDTGDMDAHRSQEMVAEYLPLVIERGNKMNGFMKAFARVIRLPSPEFKRIDLATLLAKIGQLFKASMQAEKINLIIPNPKSPVYVAADAAQLEQVVINALTNARESMAGEAGTIKIQLSHQPAGFTIADNGPGISNEHTELIFTPFFSSKTSGQGIGLTLSRDILEAHGASYDLSTDEDGWTRFKVEF